MKLKNKKSISFRTVVLTTVLAMCGAIGIVAITLQYLSGKYLAENAALTTYSQVAEEAEEAISDLDERAKLITQLVVDVGEGMSTQTLGPNHSLLEVFADSMREVDKIYSIYLGFENGDLLQLINLQSSKDLHKVSGADPGDRWVLAHHTEIDGRRALVHRFANDSLVFREAIIDRGDFDASTRPWYRDAIQTSELVFTKPYQFTSIADLGVTYAQQTSEPGVVVGVDVSLRGLSDLLRSELAGTGSDVFIFTRSGQVGFELRSNSDTQDPQIEAESLTPLIEQLNGDSKLLQVEDRGAPFYVFLAPLGSEYSLGRHFAVVVYERRFVAPFMEPVYFSLTVSAVVLILLLMLAWVIAGRLARQLDELTVQTGHVRDRRYSEVRDVASRIKEVHYLATSLADMSRSIQAYEKAQRDLMDSIIRLIAEAIDTKSPYTAGHCERVPVLALQLADAAHQSQDAPFDRFKFQTESERREFEIAAWLHDCGKISTPENIVDKGSKLEVIYNRIHEVRMRFEVLWRDAEIKALNAQLKSPDDAAQIDEQLEAERAALQADFEFVAACNVGGEFLSDEDAERLHTIAERTWQRHFDDRLGLSPAEEAELEYLGLQESKSLPATESLLADKPEHIVPRTRPLELDPKLGINMDIPENLYNRGELYNLAVKRGTLTKEDRFKINEHMINTIKMLERLPFTDDLQQVPKLASTHHEQLNGTGYPRKLGAEDLGVPDRIIAVADIFEALTAADRPYKEGKKLSEALRIMSFMVKDAHIDADLFKLFLERGIYLSYAKQFLKPEQIDEVDIENYLSH